MAKKRKWSAQARRDVKRYHGYLKSHQKRIDLFKEKGLTPYYNPKTGDDGSKPLTYKEWKYAYYEYKHDRLKEIEKGGRKSIGNLNDKIISDQVYELSEEKAYKIFDYLKTLPKEERKQLKFSYKNINEGIAKIREGSFVREDLGLWEKIKARRKELFDAGFSKAQVNGKDGIISHEFFYPKEDEEDENLESEVA